MKIIEIEEKKEISETLGGLKIPWGQFMEGGGRSRGAANRVLGAKFKISVVEGLTVVWGTGVICP